MTSVGGSAIRRKSTVRRVSIRPARVHHIRRIISDVGVHIQIVFVTDRICLEESPFQRRVIPRPVVVESRLGIEVHANELERHAGRRRAVAIAVIDVGALDESRACT